MAVRVHSISPSWELSQLLDIFPLAIRQALVRLTNIEDIIEVVLDLGRTPEARFEHDFIYLTETPVTHEDIAHVCSRISPFGADNRAGIEQTLHRISAIRNRTGKIVGLTCRVGRAVYGTIDIMLDVLRSGKSICLLGRPGVGKTTMLRECARVLSRRTQARGDRRHVERNCRRQRHSAPGHRARATHAGRRSGPAARGDDRSGRKSHARSDRHRRDRHRGRSEPRARSPSAA